MNTVTKHFAALLLLLVATFTSTLAIAQDKKVDVNLNINKGGNWYANPIVWVIAGAVFILLLVALMRNNKSGS